MNHPSMTTRGKQITVAIMLALVFFLPKRVECGYPGATCARKGAVGMTCTRSETEPFGFFLIESIAHRDVGFAYSVDDDCR